MTGNPQVENGYIRVATELFEALVKIRIPGEARQIFDHIMRQTYGWKKKEDQISYGQFQEATGINRRNTMRAVQKLKDMNMIGVKKDTIGNVKYSINKSYKTWKVVSKRTPGVKKDDRVVSKKTTKVVSKRTPTIDKKDTIKDTMRIAHAHFEQLWSKYPKKLGKKRAIRHYNATVKTDHDRAKIEKALANYCLHVERRGDPEYVKHGSTWFNEWEDWTDYVPEKPTTATDIKAIDLDIEQSLGRMATEDMILKVMRRIPRKHWIRIDRFLKRRYTDSKGIGHLEGRI